MNVVNVLLKYSFRRLRLGVLDEAFQIKVIEKFGNPDKQPDIQTP
jgi:hypothetical protein